MPYLRALSKRLARALSTSLACRINVPQNLLGWSCSPSVFQGLLLQTEFFYAGRKTTTMKLFVVGKFLSMFKP